MLSWTPNQANPIEFVLVDSNNVEVTGLGSNFTVHIKKLGGSFFTGVGAKTEGGLGFYEYIATAAESDTKGPIAIAVTAPGCVQQNLVYMVGVSGSGGSDTLPTTYAVPDCYDAGSDYY